MSMPIAVMCPMVGSRALSLKKNNLCAFESACKTALKYESSVRAGPVNEKPDVKNLGILSIHLKVQQFQDVWQYLLYNIRLETPTKLKY
jgi:hypothetical protein